MHPLIRPELIPTSSNRSLILTCVVRNGCISPCALCFAFAHTLHVRKCTTKPEADAWANASAKKCSSCVCLGERSSGNLLGLLDSVPSCMCFLDLCQACRAKWCVESLVLVVHGHRSTKIGKQFLMQSIPSGHCVFCMVSSKICGDVFPAVGERCWPLMFSRFVVTRCQLNYNSIPFTGANMRGTRIVIKAGKSYQR